MKRAAEFNILVDDVAITHLSFGTEFTKAVESKQVAQQEAERARFVVMKADQVRLPQGALSCLHEALWGSHSLPGMQELDACICWRCPACLRLLPPTSPPCAPRHPCTTSLAAGAQGGGDSCGG
jgi:hypothetical protein